MISKVQSCKLLLKETLKVHQSPFRPPPSNQQVIKAVKNFDMNPVYEQQQHIKPYLRLLLEKNCNIYCAHSLSTRAIQSPPTTQTAVDPLQESLFNEEATATPWTALTSILFKGGMTKSCLCCTSLHIQTIFYLFFLLMKEELT